jgi:hypothetical protein
MFPMRAILAATIVVLLSVCYALGSTDFSGKWVLDLHSSSSSDPMLKRLGVPWIERKLAAAIKLESTYTQSPSLLTIHTHGPAFSRTERIRLDNQPETRTEALTGPYTIRTRWSPNGAQLISTISFRTKDGHDAQLIVVRQLGDAGKTLVLTQTLKVTGDSGTWMVRRVWRKH